jgi:hypothetical protein
MVLAKQHPALSNGAIALINEDLALIKGHLALMDEGLFSQTGT